MVTITLCMRQQKRHWCIINVFNIEKTRGRREVTNISELHTSTELYIYICITINWSFLKLKYFNTFNTPDIFETFLISVFIWPSHYLSKVAIIVPATAKSLQSCPTLCDPIDVSPPGSPVPGILQARTLEWVAISFSNVWKWKVKVKSLSHVWLLATPWTAAHQAPPSMGFSRQEYGSRVHCPYLIEKLRFMKFIKDVLIQVLQLLTIIVRIP